MASHNVSHVSSEHKCTENSVNISAYPDLHDFHRQKDLTDRWNFAIHVTF